MRPELAIGILGAAGAQQVGAGALTPRRVTRAGANVDAERDERDEQDAKQVDNEVGSGADRMHHLALVAVTVVPPLRKGVVRREPTIKPVKASGHSAGLRERDDDACDPCLESGCGGCELCQPGRDLV
ncbi:hypothetical protein INH39_30365 [Massilia violaceinigra]|uniref:Secreted protein n=1 Tax=Massilia violaceinigra TaxID=2045208 RepID=A0ABY4A4J0_9BURK|nr:hypothetical protein [Massilia violaceinigra]UOD29641.1 hypothetical protein INH39_30365 [Massilia violaceinigra]